MENMKIIETIRKVLELSYNNPSKEEAQAAALKAQELMAKYQISMSDIDLKDEAIDEIYIETGSGKKWKRLLADVITRNFCCKMFLYGNNTIVFYGHKTDVKIAHDVFQNLFYTGNQLASKEYRDARSWGENTKGLVNDYLMGFVAGIKSVLDAQCTALMLVVPEDVEEGYNQKLAGCKVKHTTHRVNTWSSTYHKGFNAGRSQMQARQIG